MNKSKEKRAAAPNRVAAGKRASWPLSPTQKKSFVGFVGFVMLFCAIKPKKQYFCARFKPETPCG
jgi:hypothetical protein